MIYKKILVLGLLISLGLLLLSARVLAADSYEENDTFSEAKVITSGYHASLDVIDTDDDYYFIYVDSGYTITVEIDFDGEIGDIDLELHDSSDIMLEISDDVEDHEEVSYYVTSADNYYIYIYNYDDTVTSYTMIISITAGGSGGGDAYEPNNNFGDAALIDEGLYYDLNCSDDDWYYLPVTSGNTLMITINFTDLLGDLDLLLYNSSYYFLDYSMSSNDDEMCYWSVDITGDYYILVENDDSGSNDYGMNVSVISGSIPPRSLTVTNPASSSVWQRSLTYQITWTTTGLIENVDVSYGTDSSGFIGLIALNTENNGSILWTIPSDATLATDYLILISDVEGARSDFSDQFTIVALVPKTLTITNPTFSSIWNNGSIYDIKWTSTGSISFIDIDLYDSSGWLETIADDTTNDGSSSLQVGDYSSGTDYYINITDSNDNSIYDVSDDFAINNTESPIELIIVTSPLDSTMWYKGSTYNITWVWSGMFLNVNITLHNSTSLILTIASNVMNNGSISWIIPNNLTNGDEYHIEICDLIDSIPIGQSNNFTITDKPSGYIVDDDGNDDDGGGDDNKPGISGYSFLTLLIFTIFGMVGLIFHYSRRRIQIDI